MALRERLTEKDEQIADLKQQIIDERLIDAMRIKKVDDECARLQILNHQKDRTMKQLKLELADARTQIVQHMKIPPFSAKMAGIEQANYDLKFQLGIATRQLDEEKMKNKNTTNTSALRCASLEADLVDAKRRLAIAEQAMKTPLASSVIRVDNVQRTDPNKCAQCEQVCRWKMVLDIHFR